MSDLTIRDGRRPIGRDDELAAGENFLDAILVRSAILVLDGEPGIGKTTVWSEICARATERGFIVLASRPAESETDLPFAGLLDLLAAHADDVLPDLPGPQRLALEVALLRRDPEADQVSPVATSAAFLSVLASLTEAAPVVVAVDDLQWLDTATARVLGFAARRLGSLPVGILATVRIPTPLDPTVPVPDLGAPADRLRIGGLAIGSLYHVIDAHLGLSLPRSTLLRIDAAAAGNPFFALEIARSVGDRGPGSAADGSVLPENLSRLVAARIETLPEHTREALLTASAVARPTTELVPAKDLEAGVDAGLVSVELDGRIRFSHPLFAHAVYAVATPGRRARLHLALSKQLSDPDERALHAALASNVPDAGVAAQLHEAAERARDRGSPETAAELAERAAGRTPAEMRAAILERRLRAAEHHERAGNTERASVLANEVLAASPAPPAPIRSRALQLLAEIAFGHNFPEAARLLEEALDCVRDDDARAALLEFSIAFAWLGMTDLGRALPHAIRAEALAASSHWPSLMGEAIGVRVNIEWFLTDRIDRDAMRQSLAIEDPARQITIQTRPTLSAANIDYLQGRLDDARATFVELRARILNAGEEQELPFALCLLSFVELHRGDIAAARSFADEAVRTATATGSDTLRGFGLAMQAMIGAFSGDDEQVAERATEALAICDRVGWQIGSLYAFRALAFKALSHGDMAAVDATLGPVASQLGTNLGFGWSSFVSGDVLDAWLAQGELDRAEKLATSLEAVGRATDGPWPRVVGTRALALVRAARGDGPAAMTTIDEAMTLAAQLPIPFELGRTLMAKGQILRRERKKRAAREAFEAARAVFERIGMPLWTAKVDRELARIGLRRAAPTELTETERRVAELAAEGLTNREIAARAFLSPKSVEDVLSRVYGKLEIGSRAELGGRMAREGPISG